MKTLSKISKKNIILILSALGFIVTGILFYPYGTFWDSARTLTYILTEGHANVDNWLGWYYPLLWEGLYKLTGIPNIMGTYINLIYWIAITILYLNLFNVDKRSLWWYLAFAWFPGSLMFIVNIINNALMLVMLLLGLAFLSLFSNMKKWWWAALSIISIIQCAFIRRESFIIVIPLTFIILLIIFLHDQKKIKAIVLACITSLLIFIGVFSTEKAITSRIPNYNYMDALSITCLHDMSAVTYMTGKMCIPNNIFKEEYSDGKACYTDIMSMENGNDSIWHGDVMLHHIGPYMKIEDRYTLRMDKSDILSFYMSNLPRWLIFRVQYIVHYFWYRQQMWYTANRDDKMILYDVPSPNVIQKGLSGIIPALLGWLQVFYYLSFAILCFDWKKLIRYNSKNERILILSLIFVSFLESILVLFTSIDIQYRYLYPVCVIQYLLFIYVMSKLDYKTIGKKLLSYEE